MPTKKTIGSYSTREGAWVPEDATCREVIDAMDGNSLGAVVILNGKAPLGIITERDVVRILYEETDLGSPAIDHATRSVISASGSRSISYALDLMTENNFRRLVVLDDSNRFQGIVTQTTLLKNIESDFYKAAMKIEHLKDDLKEMVFAARGDSINQALEKKVRHGISAIPILEEGHPVGIITERDVLKLARDGVSLKEPVEKFMSSPVVSVGHDMTLAEVVEILNEKEIKRVVVTEPCGRASGVVTNRDLIRYLDEDYNTYLERKLAHSKEIMNLLPEMMLELVDTGKDQLIVWANEKARGRYGSDIIDSRVTSLIPPVKWMDIFTTLKQRGKIEDIRFRTSSYVFEFSGFYIRMDKPEIKGRIQLIIRDVTEEIALATTDSLTSIYNRRYMNEYLAREIQRSARMGKTFALGIADLDDFKRVNDTYGHLVGDTVLKSAAARFIHTLRAYDVVGRYGGEEFMVITPDVNYEIAVEVFERIRADFEKQTINLLEGVEVQVTVSIGVACFDRDGTTPEGLIGYADERMYAAKKAGKNRVVSG
jgi:diguanylate cyclase (GGDEF)-like protein